jgi:uncharacterized damage-inducible protein DinB
MLTRPGGDEYAPFYAGYIAGVPEGGLLEFLDHQLNTLMTLFTELSEAQGDHAYAPGKWTIKDVIQHVTDAERVFAYRLLRIARGDTTPLPGFDENAYAAESGASRRTVADLAAEFATVRRATQSLLRSLTPDTAARRGTASGATVSVRALAWMIAGHANHHLEILRERYGVR